MESDINDVERCLVFFLKIPTSLQSFKTISVVVSGWVIIKFENILLNKWLTRMILASVHQFLV